RAYAPLVGRGAALLQMSVRSAELCKYASNAMLATRISFINELANLAERLGADIEMVRQGIGSDPRIGYDFLYPGCGYGGSCFPKDVRALIRTARVDADLDLRILTAVEAANDLQKGVLATKVKRRFGESLHGRRFALWGLAFKPNTDDMREAPSRDVVRELLAAGAELTAYDPVAIPEARRVFADCSGLSYADTPLNALQDADALVIVTEWKEFRNPDFAAIAASLRQPVVFDGRNLYQPSAMRERGFEYFPIGR
ncbi:MAG: nucleotide sugar dehydrogenase, partial [Caldimonas sp.]